MRDDEASPSPWTVKSNQVFFIIVCLFNKSLKGVKNKLIKIAGKNVDRLYEPEIYFISIKS